MRHRYRLDLRLWHSDDYPSALRASWERAFALLDPPLCPVDLQRAYDGLIATLEHYYAPSRRMGGVYDVPGMPFQVSLEDFKPVGYNYQMGFVGMQVATSYYLFREGVERDDRHLRDLGAEALDFWATRSLTLLGLPRPWYDPDTKGGEGTFRRMNNLRTVTGGMESLLAAWNYACSAGLDRPAWLNACRRFGEWLVENQNPDGSYFFSHDHTRIEAGRHPVTLDDKGLTLCAVPFLAKLHRATGREEFRTAALRAGEYGYAESHCKYLYRSGVVDNPQTIDSESGQLAMQAFLALYDLDGRRRWLDAAVQAATYTETWMYALDIPVEEDRTGPTVYPRDRSVVGQHLIAIGHAAADTGFAWTSFLYYRLYLETGHEHFLRVARLAAHNTKQSMNWDGSLYPGAPHGLQLEAFRILVPRRAKGVNTTLNWGYAAHLEPMMHFRDAFGTPDLEAVERLPLDQRLRRLKSYRDRMQAPVAPHRAPNGQPN